MHTESSKLPFASDYMEGMHPAILQKLAETNLLSTAGYGTDAFCASAREKIKAACRCPDAAVYFLSGGTQTNAVVLGALLPSYQAVIAVDSGHISGHEAGAIECGGHKVMELPHVQGKLSAAAVEKTVQNYLNDDVRDHRLMPGAVYLSQPTEYGTLYSLSELQEISDVCRKYQLRLYVDGARLAYALACPENDVLPADLARLCDVFYIGGTKCGALLGEAVVVPDPALLPHFFTIMKQHGAVLAKGRTLGIQFDVLFTDGLYEKIGAHAIAVADRLRNTLRRVGYRFSPETAANQLFVVMENRRFRSLSEAVACSFWEPYDDAHAVVRFVTSWATREEDVAALCALIEAR